MAEFSKHQRIKHRNGYVYRVTATPDHRRLEHNQEPFYEYESITTGDAWVRCQSEMEDGRFVAI